MEVIIVAIIGALATIMVALINRSSSKKVSTKMEVCFRQKNKQDSERIENIALIYSEMWELLHNLNVCRVYLLQPHPLIQKLYLTITREVKRKGVSGMENEIQRSPMADMASISGRLAKDDWMYQFNIENTVDKQVKSLAKRNGTTQVLVRRLTDKDGHWIGNLFLENTKGDSLGEKDIEKIKAIVDEAANVIRFILPEHEELKK